MVENVPHPPRLCFPIPKAKESRGALNLNFGPAPRILPANDDSQVDLKCPHKKKKEEATCCVRPFLQQGQLLDSATSVNTDKNPHTSRDLGTKRSYRASGSRRGDH